MAASVLGTNDSTKGVVQALNKRNISNYYNSSSSKFD